MYFKKYYYRLELAQYIPVAFHRPRGVFPAPFMAKLCSGPPASNQLFI